MRIISKFKDYYDGGAVYGVDTERNFVRETKEISLPRSKGSSNDIEHIGGFLEIIGFCGEIYVLINGSSKGFGDDWYRHPKEYILYDDEILEYVFIDDRGYGPNFYRFDWESAKKHTLNTEEKKKRLRMFGISLPEKYDILKKSTQLKSLFLEYKTPIFHIKKYGNEYNLTLNPRLKDYAFYKIKNTIQAFQEIEMFSSNILVSDTNVDVPVGGDIVVRDSKGFDKWSFRKEKKI